MASVIKDGRDGRDGWRVRFYSGSHRRELYYQGSKRNAEELGRRCESLAACKAAGVAPDNDLASWLRRMDSGIRDTLVRWGLCDAANPKLLTDAGRYLEPYISDYLASRTDIKHNTKKNLVQTSRVLREYFGDRRPLAMIRKPDAVAWQRWLGTEGYSPASVSGFTRRAKQFFRAAALEGLIEGNPFDAIKAGKENNLARQQFIPRSTIKKVLDACPGPQWRLIVSLARYAGLRCPSEVLKLRWTDIDWAKGSMRVDSSKTGLRFVPMLPEVRLALTEARDAAPDGSIRCVEEYPEDCENLRQQFGRILKQAHVEPWERLFHNLRASCRTEWQQHLPDFVCNQWLGQSSRVAESHYLTIHQEHWDRALTLTPNCPPTRPPILARTGTISDHHEIEETNDLIGDDGMCYADQYARKDSNLQPSVPKTDALSNCATDACLP
jgi:integrase